MARSKSTCFSLLAALLLPMAANADLLIADFESGFPPGEGFFQYSGSGFTSVTPVILPETSAFAVPGQTGDNTVVVVEYDNTGTFGGFGQAFAPTPQNWRAYDGISFWMFGGSTGDEYQFEIFDNASDPTADTFERFDVVFADDFTGWTQITLLFSDFTRAVDFQPPGAPDDGLGLTEMWGYAVVLDNTAGGLAFDDIRLVNVPEPGTLALLAIGFAGIAARRRKKA